MKFASAPDCPLQANEVIAMKTETLLARCRKVLGTQDQHPLVRVSQNNKKQLPFTSFLVFQSDKILHAGRKCYIAKCSLLNSDPRSNVDQLPHVGWS